MQLCVSILGRSHYCGRLMELVFASAQGGTIGSLEACIGGFAVIAGIHAALLSTDQRWRIFLVASLLGLGLCIIGLAVDFQPIRDGALAWLGLEVVATAATLLVEDGFSFGFLRRLRLVPERASSLAVAAGVFLLVCGGIAVGALLGRSGGGDRSASIRVPSRYRVSGTCANGACTVNECTTAAPCGLENEGRLREGSPVDIVCQTEGEVATAPNGQKSQIWDRLPSGLYISDLFVSGTKTNRYTRRLHLCSDA